jgi:hypothetical protein
LNAALRRLDYGTDEMTTHGFRSMASTHLNEMGFVPDIIELQFAHTEKDDTRAAYNRATHLPQRRKTMQKWADYLDKLRAGRTAREIRKTNLMHLCLAVNGCLPQPADLPLSAEENLSQQPRPPLRPTVTIAYLSLSPTGC